MEEGSKALKLGKEQFDNNPVTVLQEIDLISRERNGNTK